MKTVCDQMTPEQRIRFDAYVRRQRDKPATSEVHCAYCDKFVADFRRFPETKPEDLLSSGAVPVPNFGWFCSHTCADAFERDFGIRFQRDASGRVSYY